MITFTGYTEIEVSPGWWRVTGARCVGFGTTMDEAIKSWANLASYHVICRGRRRD